MKDVTLETVGGGAAGDLFAKHLPEILANIQDPNTDATKPRSITISITLSPRPDRESAMVVIKAAAKLAPVIPAAGTIHIGQRGGKLVAVTQDLRQGSLFPDGAPDPSVLPIDRSAER